MTPQAQVHPHPEWRRLYEQIASVLAPGQLWSYVDLSAAAGVDVSARAGRHQFLRFRDEVLKKHGWWMENVRGSGYRVIHPNEQPAAGLHLVNLGRQRIRKGAKVNSHARIELMSAEIAKMSADLQVRMSVLDQQVTGFVKEVRREIADVEAKRLPSPLLDREKIA